MLIEAEHWSDGKLVSWNTALLSEDDETRLRLVRKANKLTLSFSEGGDTWTDALTSEMVLPEKLKIGVLALNTTRKAFSPNLESFKVAK